ncbi:selenide, water dikinase SelD [Algoriphagus machipongonensis]|uniref:Selenide, water dikinase n=1 Tax=Algoriphagus machipongonensis TaxID=388413 RepID=A3I2B8_9BACT|nr:selenide, water dikinase SelD [Algoriphagus machipongonensis]EAZ79522.1 selenide, water dikinase [Algoriphagus machipongonensis]
MEKSVIRLTEWSEGSGCGCKIAPAILDQILSSSGSFTQVDPNLLVGNSGKDDAAVYQVSDDLAMINSVDFFTPIVDDPFDFGRIAAANAISDIYAMGGKPVFANAILSWPVEKLAPELAAKVMEGAKSICKTAGIELAGGHSIAAKDPIFGLSVNGIIHPRKIKTNKGAKSGDIIYLTKPLGIGVLATALKRQKIQDKDYAHLIDTACRLNSIGELIGNHEEVHAMTDVTGFGLLGHLIEMCEGSEVSAAIEIHKLPLIEGIQEYINQFIFPDNTYRNWNAYSAKTKGVEGMDLVKLCDPQTSGGLMLAVDPENQSWFENAMKQQNQVIWEIGKFTEKNEFTVAVN